ncbi:MAG: hypothetical protein RJQ08_04955 [Salinisphaeraceae bacterium]
MDAPYLRSRNLNQVRSAALRGLVLCGLVFSTMAHADPSASGQEIRTGLFELSVPPNWSLIPESELESFEAIRAEVLGRDDHSRALALQAGTTEQGVLKPPYVTIRFHPGQEIPSAPPSDAPLGGFTHAATDYTRAPSGYLDGTAIGAGYLDPARDRTWRSVAVDRGLERMQGMLMQVPATTGYLQVVGYAPAGEFEAHAPAIRSIMESLVVLEPYRASVNTAWFAALPAVPWGLLMAAACLIGVAAWVMWLLAHVRIVPPQEIEMLAKACIARNMERWSIKAESKQAPLPVGNPDKVRPIRPGVAVQGGSPGVTPARAAAHKTEAPCWSIRTSYPDDDNPPEILDPTIAKAPAVGIEKHRGRVIQV